MFYLLQVLLAGLVILALWVCHDVLRLDVGQWYFYFCGNGVEGALVLFTSIRAPLSLVRWKQRPAADAAHMGLDWLPLLFGLIRLCTVFVGHAPSFFPRLPTETSYAEVVSSFHVFLITLAGALDLLRVSAICTVCALVIRVMRRDGLT